MLDFNNVNTHFKFMSELENKGKSSLQTGANVSIEDGVKVIRNAVKELPETPGVYRMIDEDENVLYVGKAKSLKKRVVSYTYFSKLPIRLKRMVAATRKMEFVHTHTEVEALLLESNLIKKLKPKYNILLRDDKSFPFIYLSTDKTYPQLVKHRGARDGKGEYYGPFASPVAVGKTVTALQKAFMLRNCSDYYFSARKRPCLQYHIKRCTAPCVGYVSEQEYADQVENVKDFMSGKSHQVQETLVRKMQEASDNQNFELAARYRDRIRALSLIQTRQDINVKHIKNADFIGLDTKDGVSCVQVFFFRSGQNYGNRVYFPSHSQEEDPDDIFSAFLAQFYANRPVPEMLYVSHMPPDTDLIKRAFENKSEHKVDIRQPKRGEGRWVMDFVLRNAGNALKRYIAETASHKKILEKLSEILDLQGLPERIEVYDNSHISGDKMVGAMIVAAPSGFQKNAYRKFNIREAEKSDDYGMMREVLQRRFRKENKKNTSSQDSAYPDLIIIDGGKGQLSAALEVAEELEFKGIIKICAISKGPDRHAGREVLHIPGRQEVQLEKNDPVLHYLQRIRDEAHRFAIGAHRQRRQKDISKSALDDVPGIGAKRKKALLYYFGSSHEVKRAAVEDLQKVEGISQAVAKKIYNYFHESF